MRLLYLLRSKAREGLADSYCQCADPLSISERFWADTALQTQRPDWVLPAALADFSPSGDGVGGRKPREVLAPRAQP
jgi:hypothetical protein